MACCMNDCTPPASLVYDGFMLARRKERKVIETETQALVILSQVSRLMLAAAMLFGLCIQPQHAV